MTKNLVLMAILALATPPADLPAQGRVDQETVLAGHWEGTLKADGREIGLTLDLDRNAKSEWIASMSVPAENATGLVVQDVEVSGNSVKLLATELGRSQFNLTLEADGRLMGTIANQQGPMPIEFERTGEPKVELIPASPAVSKDLEGEWEGTLGRARMIFHFKNQADGTVLATLDTPDSGSVGVPLNDVKQTGRNVSVGVRVAHATFEGTLNAEGTELTGQLIHGENGMPLTLRKR